MIVGRAGIAMLTCGLAGCGSSCNPQPPPQSDICELAPGAPRPTVTAVEIGQKPNGMFAPIVEDSVVQLVVGGQGSDMVVAALRITGTGLGSCIAQQTRLESAGGELITSEEAPLVTSPAGPDMVVTGSILLPYYGPYGSYVRIRANVQGANDEVYFWTDERSNIDATTPDGRLDAATDAAPDARVVDAAADAAPDA